MKAGCSECHKCILVAFLLIVATNQNVFASENESIDNLLKLKETSVFSVSRTEESLHQAAAAVTVLSEEDIRRSGATSVAEILRLVPGMHVARSSNSKWAVSSRGFNDGLANKLLVLIDGRNVYSPLFSGVYWGTQDINIENIDRIEVVRGPGASLWGANAVNGVVNIITKYAQNTQDKNFSILVGNKEKFTGTFSAGEHIGNNFFYRVYGKKFYRDEQKDLSGQNLDNDWNMGRFGFRSDWKPTQYDDIMFNVEIYKGKLNFDLTEPDINPPYTSSIRNLAHNKGGYFITKWDRAWSNKLKTSLQFNFDSVKRYFSNVTVDDDTYHFDSQISYQLNPRNLLISGFEYKHVEHNNTGTNKFSFSTPEASSQLFSAFVQDRISLIQDLLTLTVGSKFERNEYTNFEVQPNIRLSYTPDEKQVFWGAVSRAVRTPSRAEDDINLVIASIPDAGYLRWIGNDSLDSENLTSYEFGYRNSLNANLNVDFSSYINYYSDIRSHHLVDASMLASDTLAAYTFGNDTDAVGYGAELSLDFIATPNWHLIPAYSYSALELENADIFNRAFEGSSPKHNLTVRSLYNITDKIEWDNIVYWVGALPSKGIDSYVRLDTRIGINVTNDAIISLVVQNILDDRQQEFTSSINESSSEIGRSIYAKLQWAF